MPFIFNPLSGTFDSVSDTAKFAPTVPTKVPAGSVFLVSADTQMLFSEEIDVDGELDLEGILVQVN